MADMSSAGVFPQPRVPFSYYPTAPPKVPHSASSYPRYLQEAPYSALNGVVIDGRNPEKYPVSARCRVRKQVGSTNRWRLPESLYSDLLGNSQAIKAVNMPLNHSLKNIISAESPKLSAQFDPSKAYSYRSSDDRPYRPVCANYSFSRTQEKSPERLSTTPLYSPLCSNRTILKSKVSHELPRFSPKTALTPTPKDTFLYHSKTTLGATRPGQEKLGEHDVLLRCLKTDWELHRPFLQKSETLAKLLQNAGEEKEENYYKNPETETLDDIIAGSQFYDKNFAKESDIKLNTELKTSEGERTDTNDPARYCKSRLNSVTTIFLCVKDAMVTRKAFAIALGSLYTDDVRITEDEAANIYSAARVLKYKQLMERCREVMMTCINHRTVCKYHKAASKYHDDEIVEACERWLELNLIPQIASQIQLRDVPMDLLQKILNSNRLFVFNEYGVYKTLVYWLFFQLNPDLQLMPSHSSILSFFNSLPKSTCMIDKEEGQSYGPLFSALRLQGITDTNHVQDMQMMNIVPQKWLIDLLSQHYSSLQAGGDMSALRTFPQASIRYGFIIESDPHYHSEIISLHGFHFELKAVKQGTSKSYVIYLQRLKPQDPVLSFKQCERHTFSMRADRSVKYCITVRFYKHQSIQEITTGVLSEKFGLGEKTSKGEPLVVENAEKPLYVAFSILFPPS